MERFGKPTWRRLVEAVEDHVGGNNHALAQAIAAEHPGVCACSHILGNHQSSTQHPAMSCTCDSCEEPTLLCVCVCVYMHVCVRVKTGSGPLNNLDPNS